MMTPDEEHAFFADPANQRPQGPARRQLSDAVPVLLDPDVLEAVRERARRDDRSISSWIRLAVEHELARFS
jgi:hypothetical protein